MCRHEGSNRDRSRLLEPIETATVRRCLQHRGFAIRRGAAALCEELPEKQTGWLAGLKDPFVSRALSLLHGRVAQEWTVDDLGREVGLSRSALADRFTRVIGEPPMRYLARWRIQVAAHQLRNSDTPLARIAEQVGYESEGAFNRAFKRSFGIPPATWRKQKSVSPKDIAAAAI